MVINAKDLDGANTFECDVCIIGAGVVGSVLAIELIDSGLDIILLESGNEYYDDDAQALYKAESIPEHFDNPLTSRLRMLGGSSNHWENSTEEFDPIDFEKRSWIPESGWPINYEDVKPYYSKAGQYCNVGSVGFDSQTWQKISPFDDVLENSSDFETSFTKSSIIPTAFYDDHLEKVIAKNNLRIFINATLTDVTYDNEIQKISSIKFNAVPNLSHQVKSKIFVMCLGGLENARVLLTFNEKYQDRLGNANGNVGRYFMEHPTIRGLHFYPFKNKPFPELYTNGAVRGSLHLRGRIKLKEKTLHKYKFNNLRFSLTSHSNLTLSHGVSSAHILMKHASDGEISDQFGSHLANVLGDIDMVSDSFSRKMLNYKLTDEGDKFGGYQVVTMIDQSPERDNQVLLGTEKDKFGLKRIKVNWKVSDFDKNLTWRSLEFLAKDETLNKFGRFRLLKERESRLWESQLGFGHHHMGTTRMGGSMKNGVVDKNCKVFGADNFYIGGSSTFPTGGHVPPTLTIVAMTIRLARHVERLMV